MNEIFNTNEFNPASYDAGFEDGKNSVLIKELIFEYIKVFGDITLSELLARIQELDEEERDIDTIDVPDVEWGVLNE